MSWGIGGTDINEPDDKYMMPIHHAVLSDKIDIVKTLVKFDAKLRFIMHTQQETKK